MESLRTLFSRHRFFLSLAIVLGILAALSNEIDAFQGWQHDLSVKLINRPKADDIAIIAIDEKSLDKLGRWPWSRNIHAQLIDALTEAKVKAIAMDIFFMEAEENNPEADLALAKAIQHNGKVVLPVILEQKAPGELQSVMPLKQLAQSASLGFANMPLGTDGVLRGLYLQAESAGNTYYSLAQTLLDTASPSFSGQTFPTQPQHLQMHDYRMIMTFPSKNSHFPQFSYWDVLMDESVRNSLQGKYILVGMTAAGLAPQFAIPALMSPAMMSGVEFNANAILALQSGLAIAPVPASWRIAITFWSVFIPVVLFGFFSAGKRLIYLAMFSAGNLALSILLLQAFALWYAPFNAIFWQILSYPLLGWYYQKRLAQHLLAEKEQANTLLHAIGDAVITTDACGIIQFMNPVAELITGYPLAQAQGQAIEKVVSLKKDKRGDIFTAIHKFLATEQSSLTTKPLSLLSQDNQKYAVRITVNAVRDVSGAINAIIFALSDISEIIEVSRKMKHLATHDALTQLPNRILLGDRLSGAINMGERHLSQFAVLFIDLDGFKKVNDTQGHNIGDLLLKEVAIRLCSQKRKTDTVARWGGDEFVILLESIAHNDDVIEVAKDIIQLLSTPFKIEGHVLLVSPSIGISLYPKDGHHANELLEKADAAMYQVKRTGRNNFCFYDPKLDHNFY